MPGFVSLVEGKMRMPRIIFFSFSASLKLKKKREVRKKGVFM